MLVGSVGGIVVGLITEYYTGGSPVEKIAKDGETGSATVLISGLAILPSMPTWLLGYFFWSCKCHIIYQSLRAILTCFCAGRSSPAGWSLLFIS